jgi:hypothetical protein
LSNNIKNTYKWFYNYFGYVWNIYYIWTKKLKKQQQNDLQLYRSTPFR